jgi:hypothetical protein
VVQRASSSVIKQEAIKHGMRTLRDDGWTKALKGVTTLEEVLRVSEEDEAMTERSRKGPSRFSVQGMIPGRERRDPDSLNPELRRTLNFPAMPRFSYTARSASGEKVQSTVDAADKRARCCRWSSGRA